MVCRTGRIWTMGQMESGVISSKWKRCWKSMWPLLHCHPNSHPPRPICLCLDAPIRVLSRLLSLGPDYQNESLPARLLYFYLFSCCWRARVKYDSFCIWFGLQPPAPNFFVCLFVTESDIILKLQFSVWKHCRLAAVTTRPRHRQSLSGLELTTGSCRHFHCKVDANRL